MSGFKIFDTTMVAEPNSPSLLFYDNLGFSTVRLFTVQGCLRGDVRGRHAHRECRQLIFVSEGSFQVELKNQSNEIIFSEMMNNNSGLLLVEEMTWVVLRASQNQSSFVCLCDQTYSEDDYIRSASEYFKGMSE